MTETQQLLSELARVKALFQARTIAAVLDAKPPQTMTPEQPKPEHTTKKDNG